MGKLIFLCASYAVAFPYTALMHKAVDLQWLTAKSSN